MTVTTDLSEFGQRELKIAGELLTAYKSDNDNTKLFYGENVNVGFNKNSGYVFLTDDNYNVAVMENGKLVDFLSCPNCGHEGNSSEFLDHAESCCKEFYEELF